MTEPETLTMIDLCALTGFSYRQLDYWVSLGRLRPIGGPFRGAGRGKERTFTRTDARNLTALRQMTQAGVALHRAWELIGKLGRLAAWDRVIYADARNRLTDQPEGPVALRIDLTYLATAHTAPA